MPELLVRYNCSSSAVLLCLLPQVHIPGTACCTYCLLHVLLAARTAYVNRTCTYRQRASSQPSRVPGGYRVPGTYIRIVLFIPGIDYTLVEPYGDTPKTTHRLGRVSKLIFSTNGGAQTPRSDASVQRCRRDLFKATLSVARAVNNMITTPPPLFGRVSARKYTPVGTQIERFSYIVM